ncbi:hypothetical protein [Longimicrobium sp.]|uniref:hypothetical protein n=1 Tax=Longimicrobium sp. TaxID=2029185 RepID=UPI002CC4A55D|nr:hypothetical protein [Longimicrobium sp.]HSU15156.1 hypothetical protein [Longimicrobium sp.]
MRRALPALLALCALLAGCHDPFGLSRRTIVGDYQLEKEEDLYYLQAAGRDEPDAYTGRAVDRIGWGERYIVAHRTPAYGGHGDEWVIVDTKEGIHAGPFSAYMLTMHPEANGIAALPAEQRWNELPVRPASKVRLALVAVLVLGSAAAAWQAARMRRERRRAEALRRLASGELRPRR